MGDRDRLRAFLTEKRIGSAIYYPLPLHRMPALEFLGYAEGAFPVAEECARRCLSLPVWPGLTRQQVRTVAETVIEFFENNPMR